MRLGRNGKSRNLFTRSFSLFYGIVESALRMLSRHGKFFFFFFLQAHEHVIILWKSVILPSTLVQNFVYGRGSRTKGELRGKTREKNPQFLAV